MLRGEIRLGAAAVQRAGGRRIDGGLQGCEVAVGVRANRDGGAGRRSDRGHGNEKQDDDTGGSAIGHGAGS